MKELKEKLSTKRRHLIRNIALGVVVVGVVVAVKRAHALGYIQAIEDSKFVVENAEAITESATNVAKAVAK